MVSGEDLAHSIEKVGEAAAQTGTSIHSLNGITTTLIQSSGLSGEEAGTSIRAILSRAYGLGRDGEDGKGIQGLKEYASVDVRNASGEFKSFSQILEEAHNAWVNMSKSQQMALAQAEGGREHYSQFMTIMENYKTVISATNTSINSQNSALNENQKYLQSSAGKVEQLKVSFEKLANDTISSDFTKGFLDGVKGGVDGLDSLINKFGMFKIIAFTATASLALFNNKLKEGNVLKSYWNWLDKLKPFEIKDNAISPKLPLAVQSIRKEFQLLQIAIEMNGGGIRGFSTTAIQGLGRIATSAKATAIGLKALEFAWTGVKAAFTFGLSIILDVALTKLYQVVDDKIHHAENLKQQVEQVSQDALGNIQNNSQNIQTLSAIANEYDNLSSKTQLTNTEHQRFVELQNQIAQISPINVTGYDEQGNAIIKMTGGVKELIKELEKKNKLENQKLANNFDNAKENYNNETSKINKDMEKAVQDKNENLKKLDDINKRLTIAPVGSNEYKSLNDSLKDVNEAILKDNGVIDENKIKLEQQKSTLDQSRNALLVTSSGYDKLSDSSKNMATEVINSLDATELSRTKIQEIVNTLNSADAQSFVKQLNDIQTQFKDGKISSDEFEASSKKILTQLFNLKGIKLSDSDIAKVFDDITQKAEASSNKIQDTLKSVEELQNQLSSNLENISKYGGMLNELKDKGTLSSSSKKEILTKEPDLIPYLSDTNKLTEELTKRISDLKSQSEGAFSAVKVKEENDSLQSLLNTYNELSGKTNLSVEEQKTLASTIEQLKGKVEGFIETKGQDDKATSSNISLTNDRINVLQTEEKYLQLVAQVGKDKAKDAIASEILNTKTTYAEVLKRIEAYKKEIEALQAVIDAKNDNGGMGTDANGNPVFVRNQYESSRAIGSKREELSKLEDVQKAVEEGEKNLGGAGKELDGITNNLTADTNKQTESTKASSNAVKDATNTMKNYENQIKELDLVIKQLDADMGHLNVNSDAYIAKLDEKQNALQKELDLTKQSISANEANASSLKNLASAYGDVSSASSTGSSTSSGGSWNGKYSSFINQASQKYGVDANLIAAVIQQESGWNPNVVSSAGAKGLMQKMEGTNLFDPQSNIMQGTKELADDLRMFNGNVKLALAAYNAGPGAVQKYGGIPPYAETQNYVPSVLSYYQKYSGGQSIPQGSGDSGSESNYNTLTSGAESLQSSIESEKQKAIDLQNQIDQIKVDKYNSKLGQFNDKISQKEAEINTSKTNADLYSKGSQQQTQYFTEQSKLINEKYGELTAKEQYIQSQLQSNIYDEKTVVQMKKDLQDVKGTELSTVKDLHDAFSNMWDSELKSTTQIYDNNIATLQNKLDTLDTLDKNNYTEKIALNQKIVEQEELKKQKIDEQIKKLREMLLVEQYSSTKDLLNSKISEYLKQADEVTKAQNDAKNNAVEMAQSAMDMISTVESKIAEIIKKEVETQKEAYDKDLDNFRSVIEEKKQILEDQYSEEDYLRNLSEENQKKQDIQTQIDKLSLDSSDSAKAMVVDLKKQLSEQQKTIDDKARQHEKEQRTKALDDELSAQEKSTQNAKDALDEKYTDEEINVKAREALQNGYYTNIKGNIQDLSTVYKQFEDTFGEGMTSMGETIETQFIQKMQKAIDLVGSTDEFSSLISNSMSSDSSSDSSSSNNNTVSNNGKIFASGADMESAKTYLNGYGYQFVPMDGASEGQYTASEGDLIIGGESVTKAVVDNGATRLWGADRYATADAIKEYVKKLEVKSYANGGLITEREQVSILHGKNANSSFEAVLNEPQLVNLTQSTIMDTLANLDLSSILASIQIPSILSNISLPSIPNISTTNTSTNGDVYLQFDKLIEVQGNVDKSVVSDLQTITSNVLNELKNQLNKRGIGRQLGLSQ